MDDVLGLQDVVWRVSPQPRPSKGGRGSGSRRAGSAASQEAKMRTASLLGPVQLEDVAQEAKQVYRVGESGWLDDEDVITIAPRYADDDQTESKSWKWVPIRNSKRRPLTKRLQDDLQVFHWKGEQGLPPEADYRFSAFSGQRLRILEYTDEEYETHLRDPDWTREQTDRLLRLCREYDLRFIVIHDRYNPTPPPSPPEPAAAAPKDTQTPSSSAPAASGEASGPRAGPRGSAEAAAATAAATTERSGNAMDVDGDVTVGDPTGAPAVASPSVDNGGGSETTPVAQNAGTNGASAPGQATSSSAPPATAAVAAAMEEVKTTSTDAKNDSLQTSAAPPPAQTPPKQPASGSSGAPAPDSKTPDMPEAKSVEELKDRFYSVQRTLLRVRNGNDRRMLKEHPMFRNEFDLEYESYRRKQLDLLLRRTADQEFNMATKTLEAYKLNQRIKQIKRVLGERTGHSSRRGTSGSSSSRWQKRNHVPKHRLPQPLTPRVAPIATATSSSSRQKSSSKPKKSRGVDKLINLEPAEIKLAEIPASVLAKEATVYAPRKPGVYLQSTNKQRPTILRGRMPKQLEHELTSKLGLSGQKKDISKQFSVPTEKVMRKLSALKLDIVSLLNMRQHIAKKEQERNQLRAMLRDHSNQGGAWQSQKRRADQSSLQGGSTKRRKR